MNKIYKCTLCNKNKHIDETPYYYVVHDNFLEYKICMCCAKYHSYEGSEYKKIQNYNIKQILVKNTDANYRGIIILMRIGIENNSENKRKHLLRSNHLLNHTFICNEVNNL